MFSLTQLEESLKKAYRAVTEGKFGDGLTRFTALLHTIPLLVVDTRKEVDDVKELISIAKCALAPPFAPTGVVPTCHAVLPTPGMTNVARLMALDCMKCHDVLVDDDEHCCCNSRGVLGPCTGCYRHGHLLTRDPLAGSTTWRCGRS